MPQSLGLGSQIQTALPLVQMRQHRGKLRIQYRQDFIRNRHNIPTSTATVFCVTVGQFLVVCGLVACSG
jgi:hypothetical protein